MIITKIDFKILQFVSKNPNCTKESILKNFKKYNSIEYRLELLTGNYNNWGNHKDPTTSFINHKCDRKYIDCGIYDTKFYDCYFLNPKGYKAMEDYKK